MRCTISVAVCLSGGLSSLLCYQNQVEPQVSEEERKRYEQEFDDYHKKLQDAKTEYDVTTKAFSRKLNLIICYVGKYFCVVAPLPCTF